MPRSIAFAVLVTLIAVAVAWGGPPSREEAERRDAVLGELRRAITAEPSAAGKVKLIDATLRAERDSNVRRRLLAMAGSLPSDGQEAFFIRVLASDPDAGVRGEAAMALGRVGSDRSLASLSRAASDDPTTDVMLGDVGGKSNARRAATFALAELAARHPAIAADAAATLKALPSEIPPPDTEGLADARVQALYQVTRDPALLKPFYDRLKGDDAHVREWGVIAFRFLKLKEAPAELVATLKDPNNGVRQWTALVLGEIGDAKTIAPLMTTAGDAKEDLGVRCNAILSLGLMKAAPAAGLMETLLADPDPRLHPGAAVALYRITGKKVPQFPAGYNAD